MTKRRLTIITVAAVAVAVTGVGLHTTASAAAPPPRASSHSTLVKRAWSGDWAKLTVKDLKAAGITPGATFAHPRGQLVGVKANVSSSSDDTSVGFTPMTGVQPMSATGCTNWGATCIHISGSGYYVNYWETWWITGARCTLAGYWVKGALWRVSQEICGNSYGRYWSIWNVNGNLPGGQVCNSWVGTSGRPCETIHG
jgi:hypothetical protein